MSIFEKRKSIPRKELIRILEKGSSRIPGTNKSYARRERVRLGSETFKQKKQGDFVTREEFKGTLRGLRKESYKAKSGDERKKQEHWIDYLEKESGVK